jgi:hypothetical protein
VALTCCLQTKTFPAKENGCSTDLQKRKKEKKSFAPFG